VSQLAFKDPSRGNGGARRYFIAQVDVCDRTARSAFRERILNCRGSADERECDVFGFFHRYTLTLSKAERLALIARLNKDVSLLDQFAQMGAASNRDALAGELMEMLLHHEIPIKELPTEPIKLNRKNIVRLNEALDVYMAVRERLLQFGEG